MMQRKFLATSCNWIAISDLIGTLEVKAKIRSNHQEQEATIAKVFPENVGVCFAQAQATITKGQAVVLYDGEQVIGGKQSLNIGGD